MEADPEDGLNLPPPPEEPAPHDCCDNDCCPCVRDIYEQALQRHRTAVRLLKMQRQMKMKIGPHSGISVQIESGGGDGQRTLQPPCAPPFLSASILGASVLTGQGLDVRRVLLLELALVGANRTYEPGDYLVVRPHNAAHLVDALLRRLRVEGELAIRVMPATSQDTSENGEVVDAAHEEVPGGGDGSAYQHFLIGDPPCTIADTLTYKCDINAPPSKGMLHALAQFTFDEEEKEELLYLCGGAQWQREFYQRNIMHQRSSLLEVLERYPSCRPPLEHVLAHIPPQRERYYSIASSPLVFPSSVHLVFPVVEYVTPAPHRRARHGLCTSWLHSLAARRMKVDQDSTDEYEREDAEGCDVSTDTGRVVLDVSIKPAGDFRLPIDPTIPLIFVCAGSGIAPFRGFLQHRRAMLERQGETLGECWLFFGFRYLNGDFLFQEELEAMQREGVLTRLIVAASREDEPRRVQDRIVEHGHDVRRLLADHNAILYVCGDAQGMAAAVHEALAQVIAAHGLGNDPHAVLARLQRERRYLRDVWSARKTTV